MDTLQFLVQGSAKEPYQVTFQKRGSNLSARCTCPAGENRQYCKHRFRILEGEADGIVSANADSVPVVVGWLTGTDVEVAMQAVLDAEQALEKAKASASKAKKALAAAMHD